MGLPGSDIVASNPAEVRMREGTRSQQRHVQVRVNGVEIHYVEEGEGPLVVLLHGFPELWYSWRHQIPTLANAGFRVVAPDLRGYNLSSKPPAIADYEILRVVDDISALIVALGESSAMLVGHDWGGMAAWLAPMVRPDLYTKVAVLNCPHPAPLSRELKRWRQKLKFAYQLFFRLPLIPELLLRAGHFYLLRRALRRLSAREDAFTDNDIRAYTEAWSQKGALSASLNYYRALPRNRRSVKKALRRLEIPLLLIWGEQDPVFVPEVTERFDEWAPNLTLVRIREASHFVQSDAPEAVSRHLVDFLRE